jgi:hypothetical protein
MYNSSHPFEPLAPSVIPPTLTEKAAEIAREAMKLSGAAHPTSRGAIRELVRSMNSYYSNRIEGQGTHPLYIEQARGGEVAKSGIGPHRGPARTGKAGARR